MWRQMDTQASVHSLSSSCILQYNPSGNCNEVTLLSSDC